MHHSSEFPRVLWKKDEKKNTRLYIIPEEEASPTTFIAHSLFDYGIYHTLNLYLSSLALTNLVEKPNEIKIDSSYDTVSKYDKW